MSKAIKNIAIIVLSVLGSSNFYMAAPINFNDVKDQLFTGSMKLELVEWGFEALRQGQNDFIYQEIMRSCMEESRKVEDKFIMSYDNMADRCEAFLKVVEYKNGSKYLRKIYNGNSANSRVSYNRFYNNQLVMIIGNRLYSKNIYENKQF